MLWALVCSTSRARILRGLWPTADLRPSDLTLRAKEVALRHLLAGRPASRRDGRSVQRLAAPASLAEDRRAFAAELVCVLETHRRAGDLSGLALVGPREMLAVLRDELTEGLRQITVCELARDILASDSAEIDRTIREALRREH